MSKLDGGQAFPAMVYSASESQIYGQTTHVPKDGMTLRDYFAAKAMAAMSYSYDYSTGPCNQGIAERAYHIADAMIAERSKYEQV